MVSVRLHAAEQRYGELINELRKRDSATAWRLHAAVEEYVDAASFAAFGLHRRTLDLERQAEKAARRRRGPRRRRP